MLKGILEFRDGENVVKFNTIAKDSFNDFKMRLDLDVDNTLNTRSMFIYGSQLLDTTYDKEGNEVNNYYGSDNFSTSRRLEVKKTNKYKSNIMNRDFCSKISNLIRYVQINGYKGYSDGEEKEFKNTRIVKLDGVGTVTYSIGLITALHVESPYVKIDLQTVEDKNLGEAIFKELKEKDNYGNILSATPVVNVGFKLCKEFLGFDYEPRIAKEVPNMMGMYTNIEDVIEANPDKNTSWILKRHYVIVTDDMLDSLIQEFLDYDGFIAFDTETTGLNINFKSRTGEADELVGVVLSKEVGTGYYFPLQHKLFKNLCDGDHFYFMERYMRPILEGKKIICHNVNYDWKVAYIYDINVNCVYDTMIAFGVTKRYEEESFEMGLKALAHNILGLDMFDLSDFIINGSFGDTDVTFADLHYELVRRYAPADADMTLSLYKYIEQTDMLAQYDAQMIFDLEVWFAKAVAYSEFYGYHINVDKIPDLTREVKEEMDKHSKKMFEMAGYEFNPNSSQQLIKIMYDEMGIEPLGGKKSSSKDILKSLSLYTNADGSPKYPFVNEIKAYRDSESIYKNFIKRLGEFATEDGFIFPEVMQLGTNTGRVSVKNPNYQSYNDVVKHYVVPRPGFIHFDSDFAQIEQRVLTSYACIMFPNEPPLALLKDFDDPDMDYHQYQAARMFNVPYAAVTKSMRQQSKGINFGLPYGMGDSSLGARIFGERNAENTAKAAQLRDKFFQGQELIRKFFDTVRDEGVKNNYTSTQFGRRRYYHRSKFTVAEIRRQAGNHVIQGCLGGDTRIQTREYGIVKIKDVVGQHLHVWDGHEWTEGDITYSGKKKKCIVNFSGGQSIICSPIHKFLVRSAKGNERFVECKDLKSVESNKTSAHRVVINREYESSDYVYSSEDFYKFDSKVSNSNNIYLDDIGDSFSIGVTLGRIASDGSIILREDGGSCITHIIAEHEYNIIPKIKKYLGRLNYTETDRGVRENRNEGVKNISVYSKSLTKEVLELDVKHQIHDNIFMDTEVLRGFLRGFFDGDGGVSGKTITLVFGKQYDFEPMCLDIQKALLFFGIRSRYRKHEDRYVIQIKTNDNARFLDLIGFINQDKQEKANNLVCKTDEHIFGPCLLVDSVVITDEYIDMYDVCNTERGYYVADGIITHNTAADIYKIAVVNMFKRVCREGWLGKVLFNGFIHDEILMEVHTSINPYYFMKAWREEFEVKPEHYCRLFAGAGVGYCWYDAKKLDLPPEYIDEIINTYEEGMPWDGDIASYLQSVKENFVKFKTRKVKNYITAPEHQGAIIKPAIWALLPDEISNIVEDLQKDPEKFKEYNLYMQDKLPENGPCKLKDLQDQLRLFCKYHDIDFNKVDIKDPSTVESKPEEVKNAIVPIEYNKADDIEAMFYLSVEQNGFIEDKIHKIFYFTNFENPFVKNTTLYDVIRAKEIPCFTDEPTSDTDFKAIMLYKSPEGVLMQKGSEQYISQKYVKALEALYDEYRKLGGKVLC